MRIILSIWACFRTFRSACASPSVGSASMTSLTSRLCRLRYAVSGERTLEEYYERLQPIAPAFMALFGRDRLSARSTLSRFLAALDQAPVEALRTVFR